MSLERGFTLVEVLVAMAVTALIGIAGATLLIQTMSAGEKVNAELTAVGKIELARALMLEDFAHSVTGVETPTAGTTEADKLVLILTRSGWPNPNGQEARSDLQPVQYRFEKQSLVRRAWLRANPVAGTPYTDRVVLSGVEKVRTRFYSGGVWRDDWSATQRGKPDLVELTIEWADDTRLVQSFCLGSDL